MVFNGTLRVPGVRNRFELFFPGFSFYQTPIRQAYIFVVSVGVVLNIRAAIFGGFGHGSVARSSTAKTKVG